MGQSCAANKGCAKHNRCKQNCTLEGSSKCKKCKSKKCKSKKYKSQKIRATNNHSVKFTTWAYRIAVNYTLNHIKRKKVLLTKY